MREARQRLASSFTRLHDVLGKALGDVAKRTTQAQALQPIWREAVGEQNAAHSWPVSLTHGVLRVRADHPARAQALTVLQGRVLKRLEELMGKRQVTKLELFVGA